ncbi:MAG TPA: indole-3-glycerol phosphate synthase TrpC [Terriglobales bacterium]|nr:indole-3-glycerol phosphate synthase TrpC [Terriglobales bacterium]
MPAKATSPAPALPSILQKIVARRREQVTAAEAQISIGKLRVQARERQPRDFLAALRGARRPAIIAEIKRASPSRGRLREDFDVAQIASGYEAAGAAALSVLTEEDHFEGRLEYLAQARQATRLPILRKDFIFSSYQIWEAAVAGADAVLLIAAMLDDATLASLLEVAERAKLAALCEVHDAAELERVASAGASLIGVNNRDLHTFEVGLERGLELGAQLPARVLGVAESGLRSGADLARFSAAGYQAFLIGEPFMQASDPGLALARLRDACHRPFVKICGITNLDDALQACAAGADAVGFVFAASPRRVSVEQARAISPALPAGVVRVGVFAGMPTHEIRAVANACGLHAAQLHGAYSIEDGRRLAAHLPVWRAVAMPQGARAALAWAPHVERFVLDTAVAGVAGGSGQSFDWDAARGFADAVAALPQPPGVLVAGGLSARNAAIAIRQSHAEGADVASGVERAPGRKDPLAVVAFIQAAHTAFRGDPA